MNFLKKYLTEIIDAAVVEEGKNLAKLAEKDPKANFVDLGSGPERYFKNSLLRVVEEIGTKKITVVDIYPDFLKDARKYNFNVIKSDFSKKLKFGSSQFDAVLSNQVIEHLYDVDLFVSEIYRILKPGGYAILGTENLAAWYNILPLFFGYQPFISTNISFKRNIGNPLTLHPKEQYWSGNKWMGHIKLFSYQAFADIFKVHRFVVEKVLGSGYYPLPASFANFLSSCDVRHSCRLQVKVRKKRINK